MKYIFIGDATRVHATSPALSTLRSSDDNAHLCGFSYRAVGIPWGSAEARDFNILDCISSDPRLELARRHLFSGSTRRLGVFGVFVMARFWSLL